MNLPAPAFRGDFPSSSLSGGLLHPHHLHLSRLLAGAYLTPASRCRCLPCGARTPSKPLTRSNFYWRMGLLCQATAQTDPEGKNDEEKTAISDGGSTASINGVEQKSEAPDSQLVVEQPTKEDVPSSVQSAELSNVNVAADDDPNLAPLPLPPPFLRSRRR